MKRLRYWPSCRDDAVSSERPDGGRRREAAGGGGRRRESAGSVTDGSQLTRDCFVSSISPAALIQLITRLINRGHSGTCFPRHVSCNVVVVVVIEAVAITIICCDCSRCNCCCR